MSRQMLLLPVLACALAAETVPLDPANLKLLNVTASRVTWKGRAAVRIADAGRNVPDGLRLATVPGLDFEDGVIELDLAGDTVAGAPPAARGFTGIAFRVTPDNRAYECFYLRPKNGRAGNQEQRNHSAQYISEPGFPWQKLRQETPSRYESYVDLVPGGWTKVRIEVRGAKALLYVHDASQPTLIVSDLKRAPAKGAIALWVGPGTVAHFSNLRVTRK